MKSSKFFIAAGATLLSVCAFVATKANKKFTGTNSAFIRTVGINLTLASGNHFTITDNGKGKAMFVTSTGASYTLRTTSLQQKTLFYN